MSNKLRKIAGLCVIVPALLSGCGNQQSPQTAAASTAQPQQNHGQTPADTKQPSQDRPMMNQAQRQMFNTFQTLLMLDKADGLAITKEQAQGMLPVAQDIIAKAELSDDNKAKLLEKLTDAQKKYIDDSATRMSNRGNGGGNGTGNNASNGGGNGTRNGNAGDPAKTPGASSKPTSSVDEGTSKTDQGQVKDGSQGQPADKAQGQPNGKGAGGNGGGNANDNGGNNGNRPAGGEMRDPGKQLVELLQNKIK